MTVTAALVLFSVIWFLVFFLTLQIGIRSQADEGSVVPGTPRSAPAREIVWKRAKIATVISVFVFTLAASLILSGWISIRDLDVRGVMGPEGAIEAE
jgi:predicted secreted protein